VAVEGPEVEIAVKSAARGGEGLAGWGAVLRMGDHVKVLSDVAPSTTANAMLIRGATAALQALNRPCRVVVTSDADYLIKGASQWIRGWQARGWQTRSGDPVANRAAWEALLEAAAPHQVTWVQARGEEAPADLERAGELAAEAVAPEATDED
jgi:ribonuclease HI